VGANGVTLYILLDEIEDILCDLGALILTKVSGAIHIIKEAYQIFPLEILYLTADSFDSFEDVFDSLFRSGCRGLVEVYRVIEYLYFVSFLYDVSNFLLILCNILRHVPILQYDS
jgi:hypothetical protein